MSTPLADLDELILRCRDERAKAYLREAVQSYRSGAFRSAIVSTWIAVCFDFIHKLHELSLAGDKEAENYVNELERIRASGDIAKALRFERELLNAARDKFELVSPLEHIDLSRLQEDRNRCAHPSLVAEGEAYNPSAELARLHISSAVTAVLQHPPAQGKYALDRLVKEVASDYFPIKHQEAEAFLATGPLRKPRESLIRNFAVVLLKSYLLQENAYKHRLRIVAALRGTASLHPREFSTALGEKLSPILRQVEDGKLFSALPFFDHVPDVWQFLDVDVAQRLNNYVSDMPAEHFDDIEFPLRFEPLRESARRRVARATRKELEEQIFFVLPTEVGDRFIAIYLSSHSFDQANSWAKHMALHASDFSPAQIRRIISEASGNSQILGSFELGSLINALRKRKTIPEEEFESLLADNGLEEYAEDLHE